jgi:hypothetical protein
MRLLGAVVGKSASLDGDQFNNRSFHVLRIRHEKAVVEKERLFLRLHGLSRGATKRPCPGLFRRTQNPASLLTVVVA